MTDKFPVSRPSMVGPSKKANYKRNFVNALEIITPGVYLEEDVALSSNRLNPISEILNSHMVAANNVSAIGLGISATTNYGHLSSVDGISNYFIPQNRLTNISPFDFEKYILKPNNYRFSDFTSSADFKNFVDSTLLPNARLNTPNAGTYDSTITGTHEYLIKNLSWLYFLNTSAHGSLATDPSSIVSDLIVKNIFTGVTLTLEEALPAFAEYIWKNYETCSTFRSLQLIPNDFLAGTGTYTSGTQQLDKLKTLVSVLYSSSETDKQDLHIKTAFDNFITASIILDDTESNGPFYKFIKALGFYLSDLNEETQKLSLIYDIQNVPEEYLELVAELIGWRFFGPDPDRWRVQLQSAVNIYKATGTKKALQYGIDSIFAQGTYNIENNITEVYESYIPFLLYYALATESPLYTSLNDYTLQKAIDLNIAEYNSSSLTGNIELAVDHIILQLVKFFPEYFPFGKGTFPTFFGDLEVISTGEAHEGSHFFEQGKVWAGDPPLSSSSIELQYKGDENFKFNYRDRTFPIPPFEEYKYYKDAYVTESMLLMIVDILTCTFGVRKQFALELADHIRTYTNNQNGDLLYLDNGWLFFTENLVTPTNEDYLFKWIGNEANVSGLEDKDKYISLWNGKSSHIKILLDADSFDFTSDDLDINGSQLLFQIARVVNDFIPAHAIPDLYLSTSAIDDEVITDTSAIGLHFDKREYFAGFSPSALAFARGGIYGTNFHSSGNAFGRKAVNTVRDLSQEDATGAADDPIIAHRTAWRRRNYKNSLPKDGYYDRTGFNMPNSFEASTLEKTTVSSLGFLPLGYISYNGIYQNAADVNNLHAVWDPCENLDSSNTFFEADTSNTFPCRGLLTQPVSSNYYNNRGQLHESIALMHRLNEKKKFVESEKILLENFEDFAPSADWVNQVLSIANSGTNANTFGPNSEDEWYNFAWGRGIQKLYKDYMNSSKFDRHHTRPDLLTNLSGGPDIISHTYTGALHNGYFNINGSGVNANPYSALVASSFATSDSLHIGYDDGSGILSFLTIDEAIFGTSSVSSLNESGVFDGSNLILSDLSSIFQVELRNSHILSGVEFVITAESLINPDNGFRIFEVDPIYANQTSDNYLIKNRVIKCKNIDGLTRLRFPIKGNYGVLKDNFLIPEHEYEVSINHLVGEEAGTSFGGASLGVFIHTQPEGDQDLFWIWSPEGEWVMSDASAINKTAVLEKYSHVNTLPVIIPPPEISDFSSINTTLGCIDEFEVDSSANVNNNPAALKKITESDFSKFNIKFDTFNQPIVVPPKYYGIGGVGHCSGNGAIEQVHRLNQAYVFEVYMMPNYQNLEKYLLLDYVSVKDLTLQDRAKIKLPISNEVLTPEELGTPFNPYCRGQKEIVLEPDELLTILRFFNKMVDDRGSRDAAVTASTFETGGGSRLNYREHPKWDEIITAADANHGQLTSIQVDN